MIVPVYWGRSKVHLVLAGPTRYTLCGRALPVGFYTLDSIEPDDDGYYLDNLAPEHRVLIDPCQLCLERRIIAEAFDVLAS